MKTLGERLHLIISLYIIASYTYVCTHKPIVGRVEGLQEKSVGKLYLVFILLSKRCFGLFEGTLGGTQATPAIQRLKQVTELGMPNLFKFCSKTRGELNQQ